MQVIYLHVNFFLKFERTVFVDTNPLFILRSMMGKNLRSMCCISKKSTCLECLYNKTCAYSYLFETILPQENSTLPGRDRGSHPFSFSEKQNSTQKKQIESLDFTLTLFGKAIDYLPYIYASFVRAGKDGIFKSRTKFEITKVCCNGKNILIGENKLNTDFECCEWKGSENVFEQHTEKEVLVELRSPLRFKVKGKYTKDFSAVDFMKCLYRRAKTLCQCQVFLILLPPFFCKFFMFVIFTLNCFLVRCSVFCFDIFKEIFVD
ncbi:MAG: CRISPR-associated protein Cas6 [Treponema sp.]|nr:CRISPR-associated protein Cas6 [Treponema sp.]